MVVVMTGDASSITFSPMPVTRHPSEILLSFPAVADAAGSARHALCDHGLHPDMEHTVSLLTSEVMGNAIRHAGPLSGGRPIVFHAQVTDDFVRVEVADHGPGFDPEVRHDTAGFGLRLVDKLSSRWGVDRTSRGCRVWFEVDRRSGRFPRSTDEA
jgi:anti-sigma regulatory factor (Ser/Thr protein kinase)